MDPTANGRQPRPGTASQPGLFDDLDRKEQARDEVHPALSADPNVPYRAESLNVFDGSHVEPSGTHSPVRTNPAEQSGSAEPVWAQRLKLVIFVLFCIELGMLLAVLPWTRVWSENSLLAAYPTLRAALQNGFVRGAISGVGLIDIWLGIREAVIYRDKKPT
ncbi:MAG TPA: hypothetical protein VD837_07695 [Terriglobales bacterium]|nr:hypothetical protein [Terriglobales bacterium]